MFTFTEPNALNEAIDKLMIALVAAEPGTDKHTKLVEQLTKLYKMKHEDANYYLKEAELDSKQEALAAECTLTDLKIEEMRKALKLPFGLKPETLALILANLAGMALLMQHERLNVVTSKAVGFVMKLKN